MARVRTDQPVLPSLLDRLIDDEPDRTLEPVKPYSHLLRDIKDNIRRDLENLLNTRVVKQINVKEFPELEKSLMGYGVADFSHVQFEVEEERQRFAWVVSEVIARFEPRFQRVSVEIEPHGEEFDRTLHLKISAVLMIEPDPVPLIFDSSMRSVDRRLRLRELRHG
ncbi:type VI secretion system baseplate subunit TssE [Aurantivibrio plasticivorans]